MALEDDPSERQRLLRMGCVGMKHYRRCIAGECRRLGSQCSTVCGFSMESGHEGSAAGSNKWAYSCVLMVNGLGERRLWLYSLTLRIKFSYTMGVRGLLDRGSVIVCQMMAFASSSAAWLSFLLMRCHNLPVGPLELKFKPLP